LATGAVPDVGGWAKAKCTAARAMPDSMRLIVHREAVMVILL
jgi:hypothetical protein